MSARERLGAVDDADRHTGRRAVGRQVPTTEHAGDAVGLRAGHRVPRRVRRGPHSQTARIGVASSQTSIAAATMMGIREFLDQISPEDFGH
jgi:hypothetical protein